jgi:hypothetical protein
MMKDIGYQQTTVTGLFQSPLQSIWMAWVRLRENFFHTITYTSSANRGREIG